MLIERCTVLNYIRKILIIFFVEFNLPVHRSSKHSIEYCLLASSLTHCTFTSRYRRLIIFIRMISIVGKLLNLADDDDFIISDD